MCGMITSLDIREPDLGLQTNHPVRPLGADEVALALSLRGRAVHRQSVPEGGLPPVGQGQGSNPFPIHRGKEIADHVGVLGVVHVAVEVQIAVDDGALTRLLHLQGVGNAHPLGQSRLVGQLSKGKIAAEVGGADHLLLVNVQ